MQSPKYYFQHFNVVLIILWIRLYWLIPEKLYLKVLFRLSMGYPLNLNNPVTFNEKIQWLKLYDRKPEYIKLVDKVAVKDFVTDRIGSEFVVPTLGVWNSPDEIDWNSLPRQFVLKTSHGSGSHGVIICKDKSSLDIPKVKAQLLNALKKDRTWEHYREWPYKNVPHRILAEQLLTNDSLKSTSLIDYKFMCFNGKVKFSFTCTDRFSKEGLKVTFYDNEWNIMPFERNHPREAIPSQRPYCYEKMIEAAEKLTIDIPFARIDFYEVDKHPYFGEITFYPGSGLEGFQPVEWDKTIGDMLDLPKVKNSDDNYHHNNHDKQMKNHSFFFYL